MLYSIFYSQYDSKWAETERTSSKIWNEACESLFHYVVEDFATDIGNRIK